MTTLAYLSLTRHPQPKAHSISLTGQIKGFEQLGIQVDEFSAHRGFLCWRPWWFRNWYRFLYAGILVFRARRGYYDIYLTRSNLCAWWLSRLPMPGTTIYEIHRPPTRLQVHEHKLDFVYHVRDYPSGYNPYDFTDFTVGYVGSKTIFGESKGVEEIEKRLAQEGINFQIITGVPRPIALRAMKGFDVLVVSRNKDTASVMELKLIEYMASGVPVIAWDTPGIKLIHNVRKVNSLDDMVKEIEAIRYGVFDVRGMVRLAKQEVKQWSWKNRAKRILLDSKFTPRAD